MNNKKDRLAIFIGVESSYQDSRLLEQLCYGLEEEGLPFYLFIKEGFSPQALAYEAAQASPLDVGIGLGSGNKIVLQLSKLEENEPFFEETVDSDFKAKIIGSNAARLVKGLPIRGLPFKSYFNSHLKKEEKNEEAVDDCEKSIKESNFSPQTVKYLSDLITKIISEKIKN